MPYIPTVAIDFDGVIHKYSEGWKDGSIYDDPMPGAFDAIREIQKNYNVVIFTTRSRQDVCNWMIRHGFDAMVDNIPEGEFKAWNVLGTILVTNRKFAAIVYIDDRGYRFNSWQETMHDLNLGTTL